MCRVFSGWGANKTLHDPGASRVGGRESENGEAAPGRAGLDERREDRPVAGRGTAFSMTPSDTSETHSDHHAENIAQK